ncbi:MAG: response regulator transcription factor [Burkholderiales bacterium]
MVDEPALDPVIALADDHPIVRAALKAALASLGPDVRFVEAADAASALELVASEPAIDLLLMDLHMPGAEGTATVRAIRERVPQLPVAVVSADEDPAAVAELLHMGVCGFIPKSDSASVIVSAVRLILAGGTYVPPRLVHGEARDAGDGGNGNGTPAGERLALTARQRDVLRLLGEGKSNKVIARELGITEGTVKVHLLAVFRALNVRNRTAAVVAAQRYRR